jgi:hypothetical protein
MPVLRIGLHLPALVGRAWRGIQLVMAGHLL